MMVRQFGGQNFRILNIFASLVRIQNAFRSHDYFPV